VESVGIVGPKKGKMTGGHKQLQNEKLYNLYSSPHIIKIIKPRKIKWARNVANMTKMRNAYRNFITKSDW
jgi:hypothetical protein